MGSCWPWLQMWRYEGHRTLMDYLKRRDCIRTLSEDLRVGEQAVVATVMRQLLEGISVSAAAWSSSVVRRFSIVMLMLAALSSQALVCAACSAFLLSAASV